MHQPDFSAAAERNKQPIFDVLRRILPPQGHAFEIASGTGQHVTWFAAGLPGWTWQPTDVQAEALDSISARVKAQGLSNVRKPLVLDVMSPPNLTVGERYDLVYCANLIHIAPWPACAALMRFSAQILAVGGRLATYGPYVEEDAATSDGNLAFDQSLKLRNAEWGIRELKAVVDEAASAGLMLAERHAMPANNLLLLWSRT